LASLGQAVLLFWIKPMIKFRVFLLLLIALQVSANDQLAPARTNWAVARHEHFAFAFYGLAAGKTHIDIARDVHRLDLNQPSAGWQKIGNIPVQQGRLASAAISVGKSIYVLGGYTVAADGAEKSTEEVLRFDPNTHQFERVSTMPVPVDDSLALAWRDRWIVLVSGWHDTKNVDAVQLYDTQSKRWIKANRYPGTPVFGHAGALAGDKLVLCDGVQANKGADGKNKFGMSNRCFLGVLSPSNIGKIRWRELPPHPGQALYRAGSIAPASGAQVLFAGGSTRAYNYNGIGYDGVPAAPSAAVYQFDLSRYRWTRLADLPSAGMDFRGMLEFKAKAQKASNFFLFGGMRADQEISKQTIIYRLE
jgi:N-acetylneuraminic acid mutarotase